MSFDPIGKMARIKKQKRARAEHEMELARKRRLARENWLKWKALGKDSTRAGQAKAKAEKEAWLRTSEAQEQLRAIAISPKLSELAMQRLKIKETQHRIASDPVEYRMYIDSIVRQILDEPLEDFLKVVAGYDAARREDKV
jgi:hypothetical protein